MNITRVVCGIIIENGKLLAARRGKEMDQPLKWELPGGKIEEGESPPQAVVRELEEELGVIVAAAVSPAVSESAVHDYGNKVIELIPVFARIVSGIPSADEHQEIRWITPVEAETLDWAEADRKLFKVIHSALKERGFKLHNI